MKLIQNDCRYFIKSTTKSMDTEDYNFDPKLLLMELLEESKNPYPIVLDNRCDWTIKLETFNLLLDEVFGTDIDIFVIYTTKGDSYIRQGWFVPSLGILFSVYLYNNTATNPTLGVFPLIKEEEINLVGFVSIAYQDSESNNKLINSFFTKRDEYKFDATPNDNNCYMYTIESGKSGLTLRRQKLDMTSYGESIVQQNYNNDFPKAYEKLCSFLADDSCGLVLLDGSPGTGKSSLLVHLTSLSEELDKKFVFIPASFGYVLSSADFLGFASSNLKDTVLVIEDGEEILRSRSSGFGVGAVSNILNISDGILGKILKTKIIVTLNKTTDIDEALLRKGRLKLKYTFNPLTVVKSNELLTSLGKDFVTEEPMVLADIYNVDTTNIINSTEKRKIGFN